MGKKGKNRRNRKSPKIDWNPAPKTKSRWFNTCFAGFLAFFLLLLPMGVIYFNDRSPWDKLLPGIVVVVLLSVVIFFAFKTVFDDDDRQKERDQPAQHANRR